MLLSKFSKLIIACSLIFGTSSFTIANTYKLPESHTNEHRNLIAKQQNIGDQIKVEDTEQFLDILFSEEEEPEFDIYTEGWDSQSINPYANAEVPNKMDIDVSNYSMPHPGYLTSVYGYRRRFRREHKGVDLKVHIGDTIRSAFDGKVRLTKFQRRGYGYYVVIRHTNGLETVYAHLSKFLVEPDQYVKAGEPIALGGNTGRSTGPHLHFETRYMGYPINPAAIFDFPNQTTHSDSYTFTKTTYKKARNYDAKANQIYANKYRKDNAHKFAAAAKQQYKSSGGGKTYRIRRGDSLSKIASRNGTTVRNLCRLNGLKTTSKLKIGQVIRLR